MEDVSIKCTICGGSGRLIHLGTRDKDFADIYECENCGTKFVVSQGNKLETDYENGEMYETNYLSSLSPEERLERCKADDTRRYEMTKDMCAGKSVLDFGCGYGGFLSRIKKVADFCCGVELEREARNFVGGGYFMQKKPRGMRKSF